MGIVSEIKSDVKKSGANKKKILYCRQDAKVRVRFLCELDDGFSFMFHDSYANGINCMCRTELDEECEYCEMDKDEIRTRKLYAWSVYNYETKEVEIALFAVNQCTPVNQLITYSDNYGTIIDRDYVLVKTGKQQTTQYSVIPQDKNKFRNDKAKPFSKSAMLKILDKAFPVDAEEDDDDEDEDEKPSKKSKKNDSKNSKKSGKKYSELDEDIPFAGANKKKKKDKDEEDSDELLDIEWMQEKLESSDIDEDEFCEYHEIKSLKKIQKKSKKQFKAMAKEYLDSLDDDDDDDDDDEDDED